MKAIDLNQWKEIFVAAADALAAQEKRLNELDSLIGDGDHGSSIKRGFDAAKANISGCTFNSVGELFSTIGAVMLQEIGGAIGPLLGTFFMASARPARDLQATDLAAWVAMFSSGVDRVQVLGKARPGDKTMLDALQPAANAFKEASRLGFPLGFAFLRAAAAARQGADLTSGMVAKFGRAKFLGERSLGHQDPGANSIYFILDAMSGALAGLNQPGGVVVAEDKDALSVRAGKVQVIVRKATLRLEISSPTGGQPLKQAQPFTFFAQAGEPIHLTAILRWHVEDDQIILTCATQPEQQQVFLLIDFPLPQGCRVSLRGLPESYRQSSVKFCSSPAENFFGGGERFSTVNERGKKFECWAADHGPRQKPDHPWTYWPAPFFISNLGYSFLLDNSEKSIFDLCASAPDEFEVLADSPNLSFEIAWADQPVDAIRQLFERTGFPLFPPKWNDGVWVTCLGGEEAVLQKARWLRQNHVPCSALWVYDANDPKGNIGWPICPMHHSGVYPDIPGLVDQLHRMGFKVQTYLFPYFYADTLPYQEPFEKGYFLKNADGSTYQFPFWRAVGRENVQAPASILDFTNPAAKAWWQGLIRYILGDLGFDGWMHDFAEDIPAEVVAFNGMKGAALHNLYPVLYQQAAREACQQVKPDASFYARAGYTGSQAWSTAAWPGDQICTWEKNEGLASAVTACLSLSLSGMFFIGPDIGGYFSRNTDQEANSFSKELWMRWTQFGALSSIMRDHLADKPDGAIELWSDAETLEVFRQYAWLHMSLSPYLQGCAAQSVKTGRPVMQHMFLLEPENPAFWNCDDQYLLGDALLVAPILEDGQRTRIIQLPQGRWISYWDGKVYEGGQAAHLPAPLSQIPILVKEGAVLPTLLDLADSLVEAADASVKTATEALKLQIYLPAGWKNVASLPVISHRELADGTLIEGEWSTAVVRIKIQGRQNRRVCFVAPAAEKPPWCKVNGREVEIGVDAAGAGISCTYAAESQTIQVYGEGNEVNVEIGY